jgi:co-chaperonin GroES (HSP10)
MAVPDHLKFNDWETEMELKVGDQVWVNYLAIIKGERVMVGDQTYILVPYEKIILTKKEDTIKMLNGYVLIEPVLEETLQSGIITLLKTTKQASMRGIVRHMGTPNKRYSDESHTDDIDIKIGDMVGLRHGYHSKLESSYHQVIGDYWVVQRRNIVAAFDV